MRPEEIWFSLVSLLLGATMNGTFVASLTASLTDAEPAARDYQAKMDMVNQYMRHARLPVSTRLKLRQFYALS